VVRTPSAPNARANAAPHSNCAAAQARSTHTLVLCASLPGTKFLALWHSSNTSTPSHARDAAASAAAASSLGRAPLLVLVPPTSHSSTCPGVVVCVCGWRGGVAGADACVRLLMCCCGADTGMCACTRVRAVLAAADATPLNTSRTCVSLLRPPLPADTSVEYVLV
jgi:hypothetical protein